jgi:hypothetical protein
MDGVKESFLKIWRHKCQNSNYGRLNVFLRITNYWNSNDLLSYLFISISTYFMCINFLYYILYVYMYIVTFSITLLMGLITVQFGSNSKQ